MWPGEVVAAAWLEAQAEIVVGPETTPALGGLDYEDSLSPRGPRKDSVGIVGASWPCL